MRALYLNGDPSLRNDFPEPSPGPGEALVRVRLAGICATDLELTRGYYPFIGVLGHEFVGEITQAPQAPERVGQRVVGEINLGCGTCSQCRDSKPGHCARRDVLGIRGRDGAFADYLTLPLENLYPVSDRIPDECAVFTEPLAAALQIPQQLGIRPMQRVLVVGAGRLGQLIARVLLLNGCALKVVARHERQRALLEAAGIHWIPEDVVDARSADIVIEATGSPGGFALARRAIGPRGTICLKSTYRGTIEADFSSLVVDEITLVGSRCGPFPAALRLLESGLVDPRPLIDARLPLDQAQEALEMAAEPGTMKVLVDPKAPRRS